MYPTGKRQTDHSPDEQPKKPRKSEATHSGSNMDGDSDGTDSEGGAVYHPTEVPHVYTSDEGPVPRKAKNDLQDSDYPIIFIVAKEARDNFWSNIKRMTEGNINIATEPTLQKESERLEVDQMLLLNFETQYNNLKKELNNTLHGFNSDDLREKTNTKEEYTAFTDIRKDITQWYVQGQHFCKTIIQYKSTGHINLIKTNVTTSPSLPHDDKEYCFTELEEVTKKQNIIAMNKLLIQHTTRTEHLKQKLQDLTPFVIAKAFRTVVLSNKDLSDNKVTQKQDTRRPPKEQYHQDKRQQEYKPSRQDDYYRRTDTHTEPEKDTAHREKKQIKYTSRRENPRHYRTYEHETDYREPKYKTRPQNYYNERRNRQYRNDWAPLPRRHTRYRNEEDWPPLSRRQEEEVQSDDSTSVSSDSSERYIYNSRYKHRRRDPLN